MTPVCVSVHKGVPDPAFDRGGPSFRSREVPSLRSRGYLVSGPGGSLVSGLGGSPVSGLGGTPVSGLGGTPGPPPVKGKIFDTRFGLIHVQTGEKIFRIGTPPPVKGKIFDTRFGVIHVQTGKKNFRRGTPPPLPAIERTCYAAGGMPLPFTQDFLVIL